MTSNSPLFKLIFLSQNYGVPEKVEYLKCKTFEELKIGANQWMKSPQSEYYKYDNVIILKDFTFDEIMTVKVDLDLPIEPQIKKLEGKIIGCKKRIKCDTALLEQTKTQIKKLRGDCILPSVIVGCNGTCRNHYKCKKCGKLHETRKYIQRLAALRENKK